MSKREPPKSWSTGLFVSQTRALLGPIKQCVCARPQRELRARRRLGPGCLAARRTAVHWRQRLGAPHVYTCHSHQPAPVPSCTANQEPHAL